MNQGTFRIISDKAKTQRQQQQQQQRYNHRTTTLPLCQMKMLCDYFNDIEY